MVPVSSLFQWGGSLPSVFSLSSILIPSWHAKLQKNNLISINSYNDAWYGTSPFKMFSTEMPCFMCSFLWCGRHWELLLRFFTLTCHLYPGDGWFLGCWWSHLQSALGNFSHRSSHEFSSLQCIPLGIIFFSANNIVVLCQIYWWSNLFRDLVLSKCAKKGRDLSVLGSLECVNLNTFFSS